MGTCVRRPEILCSAVGISAVSQAVGASQGFCRKSTYGSIQMGIFLDVSRNDVDGHERVNFPSLA